MFVLNAVTFSALKATLLAFAIVNVILLAVIFVCLIAFHGSDGESNPPRSDYGGKRRCEMRSRTDIGKHKSNLKK